MPDFLLRDLSAEVWRDFKSEVALEGKTLREVVEALIRRYIAEQREKLGAEAMSRFSEAIEAKYLALAECIRAQRVGWEKDQWQRDFGRFERLVLKNADAYWWSSDIVAAVMSSASALPTDTRIMFDRFPSGSAGWWWFEKEISPDESCHPFRALCWAVHELPERDSRSVVITTYNYTDRVLCARDSFFFSEGVELGAATDAVGDNAKILAAIDRGAAVPQGLDKAVRGATASEPPTNRFFVAATLWLEQQILVPSREPADRHSRKRITRDFPEATTDVLVVRLRRAQRHGEYVGLTDREYTCRWLVRGHWRQQYYPSRGERSPIWIMPYVKGPDDKPIKVHPDTVFAVNR